jgi:Tfp pilus assembly protein PilO
MGLSLERAKPVSTPPHCHACLSFFLLINKYIITLNYKYKTYKWQKKKKYKTAKKNAIKQQYHQNKNHIK